MRYLSTYVSKGKIFQGRKKIGKQMLKNWNVPACLKNSKEPMMVEAESKGGYQKGKRDHSIKKVFDFYSALNSKTLQNFQLRR